MTELTGLGADRGADAAATIGGLYTIMILRDQLVGPTIHAAKRPLSLTMDQPAVHD